MSDFSCRSGFQLVSGLLGALCAFPVFFFLSNANLRFSFEMVDWKECWLGLPSWSGIQCLFPTYCFGSDSFWLVTSH